jgi:DHA1 family tetracycline resistance protein-like MFS transporter
MKRIQARLLIPVILTVFIDQLGMGIVIPIAAPLLMDPSSGMFPSHASASTRSIILGLLLGSFSIAQFFGAPLLGSLSDRFGRKKLFLLSIAGTCVGYLFFARAISEKILWLCFVSRILDGFTGGNISIAMSAIADITAPRDRARNFGLIGMTFGLGFILGPFIGGKLADPSLVSWFSMATPYWFAAILSALNLIAIWLLFNETLQKPKKVTVSLLASFNYIRIALRDATLKRVLMVMFLVVFGFNFFTQFFQVFLIEKFRFNASGIANLFAFIGLCLALTQGLANGPLSRHFSPRKLVWISALLCGMTYPFLLLPSHGAAIYLVVPFIAFFTGINTPNMIAVISGMGGPEEQGVLLGIRQSVQALAMAIPPIIAGFITVIGISLPVWAAAICTLAGWLLFAKQGKKKAARQVP